MTFLVVNWIPFFCLFWYSIRMNKKGEKRTRNKKATWESKWSGMTLKLTFSMLTSWKQGRDGVSVGYLKDLPKTWAKKGDRKKTNNNRKWYFYPIVGHGDSKKWFHNWKNDDRPDLYRKGLDFPFPIIFFVERVGKFSFCGYAQKRQITGKI